MTNAVKAVSLVTGHSALETSMEGPKRIGMTLMFVVFVMFGGWAVLAPLNGAAFAPGTVTVKSKKVVQHLEGGIVADILARDCRIC